MPACYYEPAPFRFFTKTEADILIAICECIIPTDDAPGATDAGVIFYIDKQVMGPFKKYQQTYREGLVAFQNNSNDVMGSDFELLSSDQQVEFLEMMEANHEKLKNWSSVRPAGFFNMVVNHTMQGFYGAPRHGGNRNYISYRLLSIGYPQVAGQNRYGKGDNNG